MPLLFHITTADDLERYTHEDTYRPPSLDQDGFVHLSAAAQVPVTAERYYADAADLLLLHIDAERLTDVRWEDLHGHGSHPHLYGPLPVRAIVEQAPYRRVDGVFPSPA